jgi:cell division protein FtsB
MIEVLSSQVETLRSRNKELVQELESLRTEQEYLNPFEQRSGDL